jgi:hypothetical protein
MCYPRKTKLIYLFILFIYYKSFSNFGKMQQIFKAKNAFNYQKWQIRESKKLA